MRPILASVLLLPAIAIAQPVTVEKPVVCEKTVTVLEAFSKGEWQEKPFWIGEDNKSKFGLLVNEKTKTWTLIQFNNDIACILGTGINHQTFLLGPKT
jgi:hypothetical protein